MSAMAYRSDIQILRGIAVLVVVLFHISPKLSAGGFLGVDIFFVISGFLMRALYVVDNTKAPALHFYKRRLKRIFPAYVVTILASLFVGSYIFVPYEFEELAKMSLASIFLVPNMYFWTGESYFNEFSFRPMLHLWSLGVEVQFYLLVPFFIFLIKKSKILIVATAALSFLCCIYVLGFSAKTAFFILPFRLWEFLLGFLCAHIFSSNGNLLNENLNLKRVSLLAFFAVTIISFSHVSISGHPGWAALIVTLLVAVTLAFGFPDSFIASYPAKLLYLLGKYSYSLYLVHFPVLYFQYHNTLSGDSIETALDIKLGWTLVIMCFLTVILHHFVERSNWSFFTRKILISVACSFMFLVGLVALSRYINENRFDVYVKHVSNAPNDRSYWRCGKYVKFISFFDKTTSYCLINEGVENEKNNVLLVGDSHADAIKISLGTVASRNNARLYFLMESCNIGKGACGVDNVIALVKKLDAKSVVLNDLYYNLKGDELKVFVEKAKAIDVDVYYVEPVPVYPYSVPRYLLEHYKNTNNDNEFIRSPEYYQQLFKGVYQKLDAMSLTRLPTLKYLCTSSCIISDGDKSYYSDSHHLSLTGARILEPMFQEYIFSKK